MISDQETVSDLDEFFAPWGKSINLKTVVFDSGLQMMRVTVREKNRFTMFDLDTETALHFANRLGEWATQANHAMAELTPDQKGG